MEQLPRRTDLSQNRIGGGKVMTTEQIEDLRKQIAAFSVITEKLVEMYWTVSSQRRNFSLLGTTGMWSARPYLDATVAGAASGNKIGPRHRWTPTADQLQILEGIYEEGNGTPGKQKIKELTVRLAQHGQISETNVYNWFQNRRARSKRKMQLLPVSVTSNGESVAQSSETVSATTEKTIPESVESFEDSQSLADNLLSPERDTGIEELLDRPKTSECYNPFNMFEQFGLL